MLESKPGRLVLLGHVSLPLGPDLGWGKGTWPPWEDVGELEYHIPVLIVRK